MKKILMIFVLLFVYSSLSATGVIIPDDEDYPKDLLKNKLCEIRVNIKGNMAETIVYEEFINEWNQSVDGVYSFPLPEYARATAIYYWRNDTTFKAILKVKEQTPNPGTGSGGVAALVNDYIGENGIKILFKGIAAGEVQKVELHYISSLDYHMSEFSYTFPLNTELFVNYPIDYLNIDVKIESHRPILSYDMPSHPGFVSTQEDDYNLQLSYLKSKAYITSDMKLNYTIVNPELVIDFHSQFRNDRGGHFTLYYNSPDTSPATLSKEIVFLVENSSRMRGAKFNQSIDAVKTALEMLSEEDSFNIIFFNSITSKFRYTPVVADSSNISSAIGFLEGAAWNYGSDLHNGLLEALAQFSDATKNNSILTFTTGYSPVDPLEIEEENEYSTGIFLIGMGTEVERARIEMTANLNYGRAFYFTEENYDKNEVVKILEKINSPLAKDIDITFNKSDISNICPEKYLSLYGGTRFHVSGLYDIGETNSITIEGVNNNGTFIEEFQVEYTADSLENSSADKLWAKQKMDELEWEIEVYGESDELKEALIDLSLAYGIRCRYTAYIADYTTTSVKEKNSENIMPESYSFLKSNYPNPFNPSTKIRFFLSDADIGKVKMVKIFDILGRLVAVIDISGFSGGWHEITFDGRDFYGSALASGTYIVTLQVGNSVRNSIKIVLMK